MATETDNVIELLQKFAENKVRPSKTVLTRVINELSRLQEAVATLERQVKSAAKRPPTPIQRPSPVPEPKDNLTVRLWEMFPPIPGSKYHRVHCKRCRQPMRASQEACAEIMTGRLDLFCEDCDPPLLIPKELSLTPRQRTKLNKTSS